MFTKLSAPESRKVCQDMLGQLNDMKQGPDRIVPDDAISALIVLCHNLHQRLCLLEGVDPESND